MVLHGDGSPTRRYLFAGDAADAFDTILHKGQLGQVYNVGSCDEVSNLSLCSRLLGEFGVAADDEEQFRKWVKYTHDRPFNDRRYAIDGTKLRQLGWEQKTSFEDGLKTTVETQKQRWMKYGANVALTSILVIALAILVTYVAQRGKKRIDTTAAGDYSLKPQSINLVHGLQSPVSIWGVLFVCTFTSGMPK